jgi:hypothetical protein
MSNKTDLATSNVKVSPGTSGTALTLKSGEGQRFPITDFYVTAHPQREIPTKDNAEIVHVTSRSGDVLNIERAQYGTVAKNIAVNWRITLSVYAQDFEDIEQRLDDIDIVTDDLEQNKSNVGHIHDDRYYTETEVDTKLDTKQAILGYTPENTANKGIASGYAPLDSSSVVPAANMRVYTDRGAIAASTTYNKWDIVTYRGRKILVTQTSNSGSGANPFFSASNYVTLGPENFIYAYDYGYRADGNQATASANTTALQNAVNIAALLQARVVVPPGFGYITTPGIELKDKVVIEGAGAYASIIALANTSNCHMFYNHVSTNGTTDANAQWCGIMNLGLDGRKTSQTGSGPYYGIYFNTNPVSTKASADSNFDPSHIVFNVHVRNAHDDGLCVNGRSDIRLIGVKVSFSGGNGFRLSFDTHADHCIAEVSARAGFVLNNSSTQMTGCKSYLSGTGTDAAGIAYPQSGFGYLVDGGTGGQYLGEVAITGCDSQQDTAGGIKLINVQGSTVSAFTIAENSYLNATLYPAVTLDKSYYNNIEVANRLTDNVNALLLTNGSNNNNVTIANAALPSKTPGAQLASGNANLANYVRINGVQLSPILTSTDVSNFNTAVDARITTQKAQNNGLATLDSLGKIPTSQIPDLAISVYLGNFTDTTAALANAGVLASQRGDWFTVDTSGGQTYIVTSDSPTTTGHISMLKAPSGAVSSINGQTGVVVLNTGNITESGNLYYTDSRADARAAIALAADTTRVLKTGDTMTGTLTGRTILPSASLTYNLGTSTAYYSNAYTQRLYLNSTAYLDGSTTGLVDIQGQATITASVSTTAQSALRVSTTPANTGLTYGMRLTVIGSTNGGTYQGVSGEVFYSSANTLTAAYGTSGSVTYQGSGAGTLSTAQAIRAAVTNSSPGIITSAAALYALSATNSGAGSITTAYGLYVENQAAAGTNYAIYTNSGLVRLGDNVNLIDAKNLIFGTTTGTKIGTSTSQKIGFYNATPVIQPSGTPAAATDLATAIALANDIRSKLLSLGLVA